MSCHVLPSKVSSIARSIVPSGNLQADGTEVRRIDCQPRGSPQLHGSIGTRKSTFRKTQPEAFLATLDHPALAVLMVCTQPIFLCEVCFFDFFCNGLVRLPGKRVARSLDVSRA